MTEEFYIWHERRTMLPNGDPRKPKEAPMLTLDQLNDDYEIVPTNLISLPKDLSDVKPGSTLEGDCQTYARTVRNILKVYFWQAIVWRCKSPQNKWYLPRHAVIWVKDHGWIDSTKREWRDNPTPHTRYWPVGTPFLVICGYQTGAFLGWFPIINLLWFI